MILAAAVAALSFRVVPLACTRDGLAIAGGGVLRIAPAASCGPVTPGRALSVTLDEESRAIPRPLDAASRPASELPAAAFAIAPTGTLAPEGALVSVTVVVAIPASTPAGSDIYLSTERSGYSPAEIRMDQVDARHYRLQLPLREGARLAFRVTRGTFATIERDAKGRLPPPHVITGARDAVYPVIVQAWADDI